MYTTKVLNMELFTTFGVAVLLGRSQPICTSPPLSTHDLSLLVVLSLPMLRRFPVWIYHKLSQAFREIKSFKKPIRTYVIFSSAADREQSLPRFSKMGAKGFDLLTVPASLSDFRSLTIWGSSWSRISLAHV